MRLKTYRASTMADALAAVKKDLGRDAVILHTRMYKVGAIFGLFGKPMVEVTASDTVRVPPITGKQPRPASRHAASNPSGPAESAASAADGGERYRGRDENGVIVELSGAARAKTPREQATPRPDPAAPRRANAAVGSPPPGSPGSSTELPPQVRPAPASPAREVARMAIRQATRPVPATSADPDSHECAHTERTATPATTDVEAGPAVVESIVAEELAAIKRMVGQVLQSNARAAASGIGPISPGVRMPDALLRHYVRLIENEVAQEVADDVVGALRDELTPAELADDDIVRAGVLRRLAGLIPVADEAALPSAPGDGRPLTIALIGPTGVGKTTTIAKLAAAYRLRYGRRVGLITSDTYRIAAVEQLRTYAGIIGVPLRVVMTPEEMAQACEALRDCDVVLIDTAGRSPADSARLEELQQFLAAARPHQTHLVLSSVCAEPSMVRTIERFADLRPSNVIFTKLDEAANLGVLVNISRRINGRLSYVTTGQEVPDDIEPGHRDRLARMVLDGPSRPNATRPDPSASEPDPRAVPAVPAV